MGTGRVLTGTIDATRLPQYWSPIPTSPRAPQTQPHSRSCKAHEERIEKQKPTDPIVHLGKVRAQSQALLKFCDSYLNQRLQILIPTGDGQVIITELDQAGEE